MKLGSKIIILTFAFYIKCESQNLVPNYSFEYFTSCPVFGSNELPLAFPWQGVTTNSSDYLNACNTGVAGVPVGGGGFQYARTGVAFSGIWCVNGFGGDYREYAQVKLDGILQQDSCYLVEFYCSLLNASRYGINKIGALLSTTAVSTVGPGTWGLVLQYVPQIESTTFLDDTLNWMQVRGFYTALGGEEYITIGNFRTDSLTDTIHVGGSNYNGAYYLIEDVRVQKLPNCDTTVSVNEAVKKEDDFKVYPNPATSTITIESTKTEAQSIKIVDVLGREVIESTKNEVLSIKNIDVSQLPSGMYIIQLQSKNGVVSKKFVKE